MSLSTDTTLGKWKTRVQGHLETPLFRNAYLLMLNTISTAMLGIVYWILAARLYAPREVGVESLAISTMIFVTSISGLNMSVGLMRFIPRARGEIYRVLAVTYALAVGLTLILALALIALNSGGVLRLSFFDLGTGFNAWYVIACMLWVVFGLQDAALTGLREAQWVPLENAVYGVIKMGLLVVLAAIAPTGGIFLSWSVPIILSILVINTLLLRRLLPKHAAKPRGDLPPLRWRDLFRYSVVDFMGSFFWILLVSMMPYIVSLIGGERMNGYFYIAWTVSSAFQFMTNGMTTSLTVEGAHDASQLYATARRALIQLFRLLLPALAVGILIAPLVLRLYGEDYAENSSTVFQLLALGVIPFSINTLYVSICRVRHHLKRVIVLEFALCALTLGLAFVLIQRMGIAGVGLAYLCGQTAVAVVVLATAMRPVLFAPLPKPAPQNQT